MAQLAVKSVEIVGYTGTDITIQLTYQNGSTSTLTVPTAQLTTLLAQLGVEVNG